MAKFDPNLFKSFPKLFNPEPTLLFNPFPILFKPALTLFANPEPKLFNPFPILFKPVLTLLAKPVPKLFKLFIPVFTPLPNWFKPVPAGPVWFNVWLPAVLILAIEGTIGGLLYKYLS